ncbi:MAG TPA: Dabb family protein [Acidobacteriota bacterium]|jgi:quinol monooxygenase YgiN
MLTHIVLYKLKSSTTASQRENLLRQARTRLPAVPGVRNLTAGVSIYKDDPYQCALVMYFEDEAALDRYRVHPDHLRFVEEIVKPLAEEIKRLDYLG